jgi:uncharacterized protein YtpQ (UPF0354 family)
VEKDFMYLVIDHTHGINNDLQEMVDEFEKYEEEIIDTLDYYIPVEMYKKASKHAYDNNLTAQMWLLICKSYVMYKVLYAPKVERENYSTELMLFASEKFALICAALTLCKE